LPKKESDMSESIAIHHHAQTMRGLASRHQIVLGTIFGIVVGVVAFAILGPVADIARGALSTRTVAAQPTMEFPPREIPREWQWSPKGVEVEYMYRQYPSQKLDWIQESGGR